MMSDTKLWTETLLGPLVEYVVNGLWKLLRVGGAPLGNFLAFLLWCGISLVEVTALIYRLCKRLARWMSAEVSILGTSSKRYHLALAFFLVVSVLGTLARSIRRRFSRYLRNRNEIVNKMNAARTHKEYAHFAAGLRALDREHGRRKSKFQEAKLFNASLIKSRTIHLRQVLEEKAPITEIIRRLREDLVRKLGNMQDVAIYDHFGKIPEDIEAYLDQVRLCFKEIVGTEELSDQEKVNFIQETRHAFGRTALMLTGGGSLGCYHLGVAKVLLENNLLPRIICGSSAGSIISAIICSHTDAELANWFSRLEDINLQFFSSSSARQFLGSLLMTGNLHDDEHFCLHLAALLGDLTFQEAYDKTGRVLNVAVCSANADEAPRVLNCLTAPHVLIWSAVAASSAFPGLFPPQDIQCKAADGSRVRFAMDDRINIERRWRDGSLEDDLPMQTLREMFNVNYFLVSQTNPHIVPLINLRDKVNRRIATAVEIEWKHRCRQLEALLPDWVPTKWLRLFSQAWDGDVTMVLPLSNYWSVLKAVVNPTTQELMAAVHLGEVCTWEKLPAIQSNMAIEQELDSCLVSVMSSIKSKGMTKQSRVPSWLYFSVVGIPRIESLESALAYEGTLSPSTGFPAPIFPSSRQGSLEVPSVDCLDTSAAFFDQSDFRMEHVPSGNDLNYIAP